MSVKNSDHAEVALFHLGILRGHMTFGPLDLGVVFDAVCMRLAAAIDEASQIDPEARGRFFGKSWPAVWSTRNHIAHGYITLRREVIEETLGSDLDLFERALRALAEGSDATAP